MASVFNKEPQSSSSSANPDPFLSAGLFKMPPPPPPPSASPASIAPREPQRQTRTPQRRLVKLGDLERKRVLTESVAAALKTSALEQLRKPPVPEAPPGGVDPVELEEGQWTLEEHDRLREALKVCGWGKWKEVSAWVRTRNHVQCRTHAVKFQKRVWRQGPSANDPIAQYVPPPPSLKARDARERERDRLRRRLALEKASGGSGDGMADLEGVPLHLLRERDREREAALAAEAAAAARRNVNNKKVTKEEKIRKLEEMRVKREAQTATKTHHKTLVSDTAQALATAIQDERVGEDEDTPFGVPMSPEGGLHAGGGEFGDDLMMDDDEDFLMD
uniref:Uncharacterized protein n=1 Tax=Chromera velia CCMP2878 TaxID=1169474 RepID=A0A0G4GGF2_9ALVE|eukprot:Cvel_21718.t1-p1 / transcript=Cvel_21718.t1 / gene=Cvel_21718 / organism=Chromera_velia_CCMP2878 / gene_product=hypothetical protein / transcript_product=hypothetical protein / location=Cvel_scaffold2061:7801-10978(+) / protein_length=332 / sequence_SO=supercontig / SO=protein_coding / is_pseudo=false